MAKRRNRISQVASIILRGVHQGVLQVVRRRHVPRSGAMGPSEERDARFGAAFARLLRQRTAAKPPVVVRYDQLGRALQAFRAKNPIAAPASPPRDTAGEGLAGWLATLRPSIKAAAVTAVLAAFGIGSAIGLIPDAQSASTLGSAAAPGAGAPGTAGAPLASAGTTVTLADVGPTPGQPAGGVFAGTSQPPAPTPGAAATTAAPGIGATFGAQPTLAAAQGTVPEGYPSFGDLRASGLFAGGLNGGSTGDFGGGTAGTLASAFPGLGTPGFYLPSAAVFSPVSTTAASAGIAGTGGTGVGAGPSADQASPAASSLAASVTPDGGAGSNPASGAIPSAAPSDPAANVSGPGGGPSGGAPGDPSGGASGGPSGGPSRGTSGGTSGGPPSGVTLPDPSLTSNPAFGPTAVALAQPIDVPEPASILLLGLGAALAVRSFRR